jgi:hypothetical protein
MRDVPFGFEEDETSCGIGYRAFYLSGKLAELHNVFMVLDDEHFYWAMQWKWHAVMSKQNAWGTRKVKWYARRKVTIGGRGGRNTNLWLHKEICLREHGLPPTSRHIIADHLSGDTVDCRGRNLDWATPSENRQNYNGFFAQQLRLDFKSQHKSGRMTRFQKRGTHELATPRVPDISCNIPGPEPVRAEGDPPF